jgi:hypothetical protein
MRKAIGQRGLGGGLITGIGYVFIPNDITNRDQFVSNCFNTATISIITADAQRFDKVEVNRSIFAELDFPETTKDVGSMIFYVKNQKHNQPVVVAVLNRKGEVLGFQKGQFLIKKNSETGSVSILGDSNKGNLFLNVESDEGGNIIINAKNKNKNNKVKLNIDGDIDILSTNCNQQVLQQFSLKIKDSLKSDKETILKYIRETGFSYKDEFDNEITITEDGLKYKNNKGEFECDKDGKFSFKNDQYSLTELITTLIQKLEAVKVSTSIGLQPFVNLADFTALRTSDLPKILK